MDDLQAQVVQVEATVGALDRERLTWIEDQVVKLENEGKTLRTELVEARGIAAKRKEECRKLKSELMTPTAELVEVRGIVKKRKGECEQPQVANGAKVTALDGEVKNLKEELRLAWQKCAPIESLH
jgi:hypothetical protein